LRNCGKSDGAEKVGSDPVKRPDDNAATYLAGGGVASPAAVVFLIRDGDLHEIGV